MASMSFRPPSHPQIDAAGGNASAAPHDSGVSSDNGAAQNTRLIQNHLTPRPAEVIYHSWNRTAPPRHARNERTRLVSGESSRQQQQPMRSPQPQQPVTSDPGRSSARINSQQQPFPTSPYQAIEPGMAGSVIVDRQGSDDSRRQQHQQDGVAQGRVMIPQPSGREITPRQTQPQMRQVNLNGGFQQAQPQQQQLQQQQQQQLRLQHHPPPLSSPLENRGKASSEGSSAQRRMQIVTTSDKAQNVFDQLLSPDFQSQPRFVPRHVKHFSKAFHKDVSRFLPPNEARLPSVDHSLANLMVAIDPRPVSQVIREAAAGIGRLTGLLPSTDLLDREAHAMQTAFVSMAEQARAKDSRIAKLEEQNRQLRGEHEATSQNVAGQWTVVQALATIEHEKQQRKQQSQQKPQEQLQPPPAAAPEAQSSQQAQPPLQQAQPPLQPSQQQAQPPPQHAQSTLPPQPHSGAAYSSSLSRAVASSVGKSTLPPPAQAMREGRAAQGTLERAAQRIEAPSSANGGSSPLLEPNSLDGAMSEGGGAPPPVQVQVKGEGGNESHEEAAAEAAAASSSKEQNPQGDDTLDVPSSSHNKRQRPMQTSFTFYKGNQVESIIVDSSDEEDIHSPPPRHEKMARLG